MIYIMEKPKETKSKLLAVEGLRGVACLMVVLSHICLTFYPYLVSSGGRYSRGYEGTIGRIFEGFIFDSPLTFVFSGQYAVFVFFVLSGYILTEVANRPEKKLERIAKMSLKRYPRLMIPALFSTIFVYYLFEYTAVSSSLVSNWINEFGQFDKSLSTAIYSGAIDAFFVSGSSNYNWVLWTMQIELIGSIIIFFCCINISFINIRALPLFIVLVIFILFFLNILGAVPSVGLIAFIVGYYFSRIGLPVSNNLGVLLFVIGLYLAGAHNDSISYSFIQSLLGGKMSLVLNFFSGIFIVYSIIFNKRLHYLFSNYIFVFLGKVSFSVYVIHLPIIAVFGVGLFEVIFEITQSYYLSSFIASLSSIIVIYLISILVYKYIDVSGMKISDVFAKTILKSYTKLKTIKYT